MSNSTSCCGHRPRLLRIWTMSCEISYPLIYARPLVGGKRPKGKQKTRRCELSVDTHWSALACPGSQSCGLAPFSPSSLVTRSPVSLLPPRWVRGPVAGLLGQRPRPLTCEHGEGGGLPRAVVAQQHRDLPLIQVQVQVSDGHLALVPHSEHLRQRQREPWTAGPAPAALRNAPGLPTGGSQSGRRREILGRV